MLPYRGTASQVVALNALVGNASTLEARALVACTAWAKLSLKRRLQAFGLALFFSTANVLLLHAQACTLRWLL